MINFVGMIREFHEKYGHHIEKKPAIPSDEVINLRYKLIEEEMNETLGALRDMMNSSPRKDDEIGWTKTDDLIALADGIADSMVVLIGTAISFGIPIEKVYTEVHRSNMSKSTEKNEYGKTIKGPDWIPPNIEKIIKSGLNDDER